MKQQKPSYIAPPKVTIKRYSLNKAAITVAICIGIVLGSFGVVLFQQVNAGKLNINSYTFPKQSYADMIDTLKEKGYSFQTLDQPYINGKVVYLIHCADYSFKGEKALTDVETVENVKSTFMIRPDSNFFPQTIGTFLFLQSHGWKLGYEYDCLSRANNDMNLAVTMFQAQVNYLRNLGFNIKVCDAHGDMEFNGTINSNDIYTKNPTLFTQNNLVNLIGDLTVNATYLSDSSFHKIVLPNTLNDKVIIELHVDWW